MEEIINTAVGWFVPIILSAILGFLVKNYKDSKAFKASLVLLMRSQIVGKCEQWLANGYLPDSIRLCLNDMIKNYKQMGGNHGVDILVDKTLQLPPTKGEN